MLSGTGAKYQSNYGEVRDWERLGLFKNKIILG